MPIQMNDVRKSFGTPPTHILKGITGEIKDGEMLSITGRSGSGKSTLLYIISSLDHPSSGDVLVDGESLQAMDSEKIHQFRNQKMGFVFQFHYLLPELTALENVLMPAMKTGRQDERRDYAVSLFKEFDLEHRINNVPGKLSGGEQQRVAVIRSLIMQPRFLFADEPTGNLDSVNGKIVMDLFRRINKDHGTTIIYVTHDKEFAALATRQINLVDGTVV